MEGIEEETNPLSSPVMFTGEMVYSWMFDDYEMLKPLKETAETVANCGMWMFIVALSKRPSFSFPYWVLICMYSSQLMW